MLSDFVPDDQCGLHIDHMQSHAPLDFFAEIFNDDLLDLIVQQTNKYARDTIPQVLAKGSIFQHYRWLGEREESQRQTWWVSLLYVITSHL